VMPLFHVHTFLFVSLMFAVWMPLSRRSPGAFGALLFALAPASWSVFEVTHGFRAASLV